MFFGWVFFLISLGDWALQRSGAILLEKTERTLVDDNLLTRLDGNAIFISNYNRNVTIAHNEMSWIGDGAIAAWGSTGNCLDANCSRTVGWGVGPAAKRPVIFFGWVFFLISLGGQAPHVRPMWALNTCGEPNEIESTAPHGSLYGIFQAGRARREPATWHASRAVQFHPHGGQSDFVWLSARTPHVGPQYVW